MALEIQNVVKIMYQKIGGTIDDLNKKLSGKLPVTKEELAVLINSWGRTDWYYLQTTDNLSVIIEKCPPKECYDLSKLDVSQITNMSKIFQNSNFSGNISRWDVSNVTDMWGMFCSAKNFNSSIGNWDVAKVTNMFRMFFDAKSFNKNINKWNVSNVKNMSDMFYMAKEFNSPIGDWDMSSVTDIGNLFHEAEKFNQNISKWNTSNVRIMHNLFYNAKSYEQPLTNWDISNVTNIHSVFEGAIAFQNKFNNGEEIEEKHYLNVDNSNSEKPDITQWLIENMSCKKRELDKE